MKVKSLSHVRLFMTPWTAVYQAPPSMGVSRQEYWSGVPLPSLQQRAEMGKPELKYMPLLLKDQICLLKDPGSFQFMLPCHFRLALVQVGICSLAAGGSNVEAGGKPRDSCLVR